MISTHHLQVLERHIQNQHIQGAIEEEFFQERLNFFEFAPHTDFPDAVTVIVVAIPRPQTQVNFVWNDKTLRLIMPPTYVGYGDVPTQMAEQLTGFLKPLGYRVNPARLPLKAFAVRSGLADYGHNNITYIQGLESFSDWRCFIRTCLLKRMVGANRR